MGCPLLDMPRDIIDGIISHIDCFETPAVLMCSSKSMRPIALAAYRELIRKSRIGDASQLPPLDATVPVLKSKARELGVKVSGRKSQLWDRICNEYSPTCPVPKCYRQNLAHGCRLYRRTWRVHLIFHELLRRVVDPSDTLNVSEYFEYRYAKRFVEDGKIDDVGEYQSLERKVSKVVDYILACQERRCKLLEAGIDPEDFDPTSVEGFTIKLFIELGNCTITDVLDELCTNDEDEEGS
jgi:hypothetical protein